MTLPPARNADQTPRQTLMVLTHTFAPDPAAAGQYMADVTRLLAGRGHRVIVCTAKNGHDDPSISYLGRENINGVEVRRIAFASVGKRGLLQRAAAASWFMVRCFFSALFTRHLSGLLVSTSPPFIGTVALAVAKLRGVPFAYWAMDLNPDQLIALGKLSASSSVAKFLAAVDRAVLREATSVIALDRFMADKLKSRGCPAEKLVVLPPWPRDPEPISIPRSSNPFRVGQGWGNKIVFLYSGNHTSSNPLSTILAAAERLKNRDDIHFAFVGGGAGKKEVERFVSERAVRNVTSLPYLSTDDLPFSLPAGDVHLVSLGDPMVGVIHPCKVYSAMATGRPLLYVGPGPSHVTDIIDRYDNGWHVHHNDVDGTVAAIERIAELGPDRLEQSGRVGQRAVCDEFSMKRLCSRFCDELELKVLSRASN